ncbi:hypothetical protein [Acidianus manzaensis]|uniref:Uncharacterized protein n=1 Tax=Acidianus manzaensis TaxID=282676 RepID=A0A1W6JWF9_9CREN|nr:hypothetical protein [Acidianus manzaensis]ARM74626.1 hypothetical protein B6F84_00360 [Acidianus manzaensis]
MICEKIGRSKAGKTYILRVYENGKVELTGDFFTSEEELKEVEEKLKRGEKPENVILGLDMDEILEKYQECKKEEGENT